MNFELLNELFVKKFFYKKPIWGDLKKVDEYTTTKETTRVYYTQIG